MSLHVVFRLNFWTNFGDTVAIVGNTSAFGNGNTSQARKMKYVGDGNWQLEFHFSNISDVEEFTYNYLLMNNSTNWTYYESGPKRKIDFREFKLESSSQIVTSSTSTTLGGTSKSATSSTTLTSAPTTSTSPPTSNGNVTNQYHSLLVEDIWRALSSPELSPDVNSSLFSEVVYGRDPKTISHDTPFKSFTPNDSVVVVRFQVHCVTVPRNGSLRVCGELPALGSWNSQSAPKMKDAQYPIWTLTVEVPRNALPLRYKYIVVDEDGNVTWEIGGDRVFGFRQFDAAIITDTAFRKYSEWRGAGLAIPIFSIRTKDSLGINLLLKGQSINLFRKSG